MIPRPPVGYFEAKRALACFEEFGRLVAEYWALSDAAEEAGSVDALSETKRERLLELQTSIQRRVLKVTATARRLDVGVVAKSFPPPAVAASAPILPVNLFTAVTRPDQGHGLPVKRSMVWETIQGCIGAAEAARDDAWGRRVRPWYWLIDLPAFVAGIPFEILRAVGLPASVEEHVIAQVVRAVLAVLVFVVLAWAGVVEVGEPLARRVADLILAG